MICADGSTAEAGLRLAQRLAQAIHVTSIVRRRHARDERGRLHARHERGRRVFFAAEHERLRSADQMVDLLRRPWCWIEARLVDDPGLREALERLARTHTARIEADEIEPRP